MKARLWWFCFCLLLPVHLAQAQQRLEIIPLQHRLPDQVLPTLQGLLEPGATLTAANNKLFLRASPANIAQIREALAALDTPSRRVMISVRQGGTSSGNSRDMGVQSGRVIVGPDGIVRAQADVRAEARTTQGSQSAQQQVQTVEGGEASIFLGRSLPIPMRQTFVRPGGGVQVVEGVQYVDVGTGFTARPDLIGERVRLTISPQMMQAGQGGVVSGSRLSTQIEGRLGEWISLGGGNIERSSGQRGIASDRAAQSEQSSEVWLKVDVIQ
ncbi:MAG: hypothetical protein QM776_18215 [Rhodocyclaceae bacterium]